MELALSNRNEDLLRGDADIAVRMVRPTQGALVAKRIGRIDIGLYGHRRYLKRHAMPRRLDDLRQHALIGFDRDQSYARLLERTGLPVTRDLRSSRRIRLLFDHLATRLSAYAQSSGFEK